MGLIFRIICNALHQRDKEIWARQDAERQAAAGPRRLASRWERPVSPATGEGSRMAQYLPIVVDAGAGHLFRRRVLPASRLLGPSRPTPAKSGPYECGIVPREDPAQRFPVRFYLVAMIFIIFDIEIIFLYPWAVIYRQLDTFGLAEMVVFAIAVLRVLLYLISNGALDWGPPPRLGRGPGPSEVRTSSSTIRRVPRPGALPTVAEAGGAPPAAPVAEPAGAEPVPVGAGGGGSPEAGPAAHSS